MNAPIYLHLKPGDAPPRLESTAPFKAVVVVEADVTPEWRAQVSVWLVQSGCRYMMAWGRDCSAWDDSVDWASLEMFDFGNTPEDDFVMTTWHDDEALQNVFWFSFTSAMHSSLDLKSTYIIHIAPDRNSTAILDIFRAAREGID